MKKAFIGRGGFKLSDSGGRTVIDKMYDLENNGDPEFSGTDRPEWYDGMVCVEAERTNLFLNSDSLSTQAVTVSAEAYTVSMEGTGSITFSGDHTGTLEGIEGERVSTTFTPGAGSVTCTVSGTVTNGQFEAGAYPTLYIPTEGSPVTRLAPTVPIEDALPVTGTVAGVVDAVATEGDNYIFSRGVGNYANFRLWIDWTVPRFRWVVYGGGSTDMNFNDIITSVTGQRHNFAYVLSYEAPEQSRKCWILFEDGSIKYDGRGLNGDFNIAGDSLILGRENNQTSNRYEVPSYRDEIVRVNATDDEIKAFFEDLTRGTSMQMTADEMEIVS